MHQWQIADSGHPFDIGPIAQVQTAEFQEIEHDKPGADQLTFEYGVDRELRRGRKDVGAAPVQQLARR